jgi:serine phosphatase RsbU (regulator of sigma subunit)
MGLDKLFDFSNYYLSPFAVPYLFSSTYCFILAFFVLWKKKRQGLSLFLTSFFIGMYMLEYFFQYMSKTPEAAYLWIRIDYLAAVPFISISSYFFALDVTKRIYRKKERIVLYLGYLVMVGFVLVNVFSGLIAQYPPYQYFWGYYVHVGPLHHLFFAFWVGFGVKSILNLIIAYRQEKNALEKNKLRIYLLSYSFGYFAVIDYLAAYGIGVYPVGYVFVTVFLTLNIYNFIRYKALGVETVIHKTAGWLAVTSLIIIPIGAVLYFSGNAYNQLNILQKTLFISALFYLFLYYYKFVQPHIDHFFQRRKYDFEKELQNMSKRFSVILDMKELTHKIAENLYRILYLEKMFILLKPRESESDYQLDLLNQRGLKDFSPAEYKRVIQYIIDHKIVLEKDVVNADPQYRDIKGDYLKFSRETAVDMTVPLMLEGKVIGILGIGKRENLRPYKRQDIRFLQDFGLQIGVTLNNALHHEDVLERQRLAYDMRIGKDIQSHLFPKKTPQIKGYKIFGYNEAAMEVGGDYYDYVEKGNKVGIAVGDVSGKGVGAGLVMAMVKSALYFAAREATNTKEVIKTLNNLLYVSMEGEKFMTFLYCEIEENKNEVYFSGAGHEDILVYRSEKQEVEALSTGGLILGVDKELDKYLKSESMVSLFSGDKMVLYTDGLKEAKNKEEDFFGMERLTELLKEQGKKGGEEMGKGIIAGIKAFSGERSQFDDMTLVIVEKE